jgi:hypothetical protein
LHTNGHGEKGIGAFAFKVSHILAAQISPAEPDSASHGFPDEIVEYYSLLDWMHWTVYGGAGGLERGERHHNLERWPVLRGDPVDPRSSFSWGSTACGDRFIYTFENRAGMLCHESGFIHLIGSVGKTIDWICGELLDGRAPEFNRRDW